MGFLKSMFLILNLYFQFLFLTVVRVKIRGQFCGGGFFLPHLRGFGYRTQMVLTADSPFAGPGDTISVEFIPELLGLLTNVRKPEC